MNAAVAALTPYLKRYSSALQVTPLSVVLLLFLVGPVIVILIFSFYIFNGFFMEPGFVTDNYEGIFTSFNTIEAYLATFKIAAITWAVTLVFGFILSYYFVFDIIAFRWKIFLFLLSVVPFWTSGVVRMISWIPFLGKEGLLNRALQGIGVIDDPLEFLLFSEFAVIVSYVHMYTLFMVAPLFNVMAKIDRSLIEAARDSGASAIQIFFNIIVSALQARHRDRHDLRGRAGDGRFRLDPGAERRPGRHGTHVHAQSGGRAAISLRLRQRRSAAGRAAADRRRDHELGRREEAAMKGGEKVRRAPGFIPRTIFFWLFMLFLYGPIAVIAILSFQGPQGGLTFPMTGFSLHWFKDVIDPTYIGDFRWPFGRSVILALIVMALTVLVSFLAGLAYRKGFRGGTVLFYLVITCLVAPSFLVSLGIGLGFANLEMQTQWWSGGLGAHLSWTIPIGVLIMLAVFARFDRSLEEAARDLGATEWQNLRNVVIPIMAPGMIAVGLFGFTLSYDEFPRTSLVTGTANTLPVEMVAVTGTAATPSLYAVGTMTTVFSLAVIIISFVAIYFVQARRSGSARSVHARYGRKSDSAD